METRSRSPGRNRRREPKPRTPTGRKSPSRKSPSRKSPARKSSPGSDKLKSKEKLIETKRTTSPSRSLKVRLDKIPTKNLKSLDTIDIGLISPSQQQQQPPRPPSSVKPEDISGDSEIARITSLQPSTRRSTSTSRTKLTPTPITATNTDRQSRSVSRSVYDASKTEYSDDDGDGTNVEQDDDRRSSYSNYRQTVTGYFQNSTKLSFSPRSLQLPKEYGGSIGALFLLISIPILVYYLQWSCDNSKTNECNFKKITLPSTNLETIKSDLLATTTTTLKFFSKDLVGAYITYILTLFIAITAIPIGYNIKLPPSDRGIISYHFNALPISILLTIGLICNEIFLPTKYSISDFVLKNYSKLLVLNILSAFILSMWCFIKSRFTSQNYWNPYGKTGKFLIDFSIGREIQPKWFEFIDIKLLFYRISLMTTLLFVEILIIKNIQIPKSGPIITPTTTESTINESLSILASTFNSIQYYYQNTKLINGSSLFATVLVLIYIFDSIIYEHHLSTSFELQQESVGAFLLLRYSITPFLLISVAKFLFDQKTIINLPIWLIILTLTILTFGLYLKRQSNSIKYRYRIDPYNIKLAFIDTVPTFQGKRLLLGKFWGIVRQPNYTGDIIALIALLLPLYGKFAWPPLISILLIIIYLIHRVHRINSRNFVRYNSAWQRYCTKVRYMLIPKVY